MYQTSHMYIMLQDVGFDYQWKVGKDNQVIDVYFHHHFPKAVRPLASRLQRCIQLKGCHNCIPALDHLWLIWTQTPISKVALALTWLV